MRNTVTLRVCKVVKPNLDGCILVDIDIDNQPTEVRELEKERLLDCSEIYRLLAIMEIVPLWIRYDRTQHGWHIIIAPTESLSYAEILCAQSVLGDDPRRGAFNLKRLRHGIWLNQLFEPESEPIIERHK